MFRHPDGFMAIPLFTSLEQAQRAAGNAARVVQANGRELLEGMAGAIFMINPSDGGAVLYPEEVASLLETGALAHVQSTRVEDGRGVYVFAPHDVPAWLTRLLWKTLKEMGLVEAAYLVKMNWVEQEDGAADRPENAGFRAVVNVAVSAERQRQLTRDYFDRLIDSETQTDAQAA